MAKKHNPLKERLDLLEIQKLERDIRLTEEAEAWRKAKLDHQRILALSGGIDEPYVRRCSNWLLEVSRVSDDPITIEIMSPGGSVLAGLALFDTIQQVRRRGVHVTTVGVGYTASMAGVLVQAGDTRILTPNSYFHIHEVSSGAIGSVNKMKDAAEFAERLWVHISDILSQRSQTWTGEELRDRVERKDWWMAAGEALENGFIDAVV